MLVELSIRNFAIIPSLTVSFQNGLHVLTGETGAGKSIIIDAISLLIGGRASTEYVRSGAAKAEIEGLFHVDAKHPALRLLSELGMETGDESIILRRDISAQGKSICRINGKLTTLAILRELGQMMVDIHGQHEHQSLLHEQKYLSLVDGFGGEMLETHKVEFAALYARYRKLGQSIKQLQDGEQRLAQRLDLIQFQLAEIKKANLNYQEDERLYEEKQKRVHSQKIFSGVEEAYQALYGEARALDSLAEAMSQLQDIAAFDQQLAPLAEGMNELYYQAEDLMHQLRKYKDDFDFDPDRLEQVETRLAEIEQLKRKYGHNVVDILEYAAKIEDELDSLENKEERLQELMKQQQELCLDLWLEAQNLTSIRTKIAKKLERAIQKELLGLHMDKVQIKITVGPLDAGEPVEKDGHVRMMRNQGWDEIKILISTNPGEPLRPLAKIVSGGELSRLMLALKTIFAQIEPITTLIFDEVDTGVSGRVAQAMAERLYMISLNQQVLCITHQPQLAAMADEHYRIYKEVNRKETVTQVKRLQASEKRDELARIMSGIQVTEATLTHANELIEEARLLKTNLKEKLSN